MTIRQMQDADEYAIKRLGIPARTLMSNAAEAVSVEALGYLGNNKNTAAIFCGPGNNGGDGWATAVKLHDKGIAVKVFSGCNPEKASPAAAYFAKTAILKKIPVAIGRLPSDLERFDVLIDALFGIGLSRKIEGIYAEYIEYLNTCGKYIISADIPSGLAGDDGNPFDIAVKADLTVCFGRPKVMLYSQPGFGYSKKTVVCAIGIPDEAYEDCEPEFNAVDLDFAVKRLKPREKISSKGTYGKVLVIAGSPGMSGAMSLCAEACYRSGTGLVYCAVPRSKLYEYDGFIREAISIPVEDSEKPYVSKVSADDIVRNSIGKTAVVIGPGLSPDSESEYIYDALAREGKIPIITDAQTLNDISKDPDILNGGAGKTIITPHPGEMARLTGETIGSIQQNRIETAVSFAKRHGVIVLLKGPGTLITNGTKVFINTTGNPGMATAGSGDVLCGIIASCTSLNIGLDEAAALGAYLHGAAGDEAAKKLGEYGMKAGDIINEIPLVIKNIAGS
ncbi:MAG: NAD(P)H-hydrate dehydratase [Clostridia bacterium]|nr:NAD(P)H-hydrate dehydratase [Clostridia bacterium]